MEALYRVERISPVADSHGGGSEASFFFKKRAKKEDGSGFSPVFHDYSQSFLNSRSASEVFEGILRL